MLNILDVPTLSRYQGVVPFYAPDRATPWDDWSRAHFLGNFYPATVEFRGRTYQNAEAAFQASKWNHDPQVLDALESAQSGSEAFRIAKSFERRRSCDRSYGFGPGTADSNVRAMREVLRAKFADPGLMNALLSTNNALLLEHNETTGRDAFWSDNGDGSGLNMLGLLLSELRNGSGPFSSKHLPTFWREDVRLAASYVNTFFSSPWYSDGRGPGSRSWSVSDSPHSSRGTGMEKCVAGKRCLKRRLRASKRADTEHIVVVAAARSPHFNQFCGRKCSEWHGRYGHGASPCQAGPTCVRGDRYGPGKTYDDSVIAFCSVGCRDAWRRGPRCAAMRRCIRPVIDRHGKLRANRSYNGVSGEYCCRNCRQRHLSSV
jgi:predicted NAD-dependent protein-ADP-ribosyltransferase YbiA (DUF1768 family)